MWVNEWKNEDYKGVDKENKLEFSNTYNVCKEIQEQIWQENSLKWLYNAQFAIFMWKNVFDWKDKTQQELTWANGWPIDIATAITEWRKKQRDEK